MNLVDKRVYVSLLVIILVSFLINLTTFRSGHNWGGDFAGYIDQTRTIINGNFDEYFSIQRYRLANSSTPVGPLNYSWGLPLLLSPVYYFFGLDIQALKIYINLFFLASLVVIFLLLKDRLSNLHNLILISIIAFSKWFIDFKDEIISDIPFLFFSVLSLYLIQRVVIKKKLFKNTLASYLLIGVFMYVSFMIRPVGIILLPTLLSVQFIKGNLSIKTLVTHPYTFIPYGVFILLAFVNKLALPSVSTSEYVVSELSTWHPDIIMGNIHYYFFLFSNFFSFLVSTKSAFSLYGLILLIVMFGVILNVKKDYLYIIYALLLLTVLVNLPYRQGARYLIPSLPFFIYFFLIGLSRFYIYTHLFKKHKPIRINVATVIGICFLLVAFTDTANAINRNNDPTKAMVISGPYSSASLEVFDYITKKTNKDDSIIFFKPRVLSFYTNRKSFAINNFTVDAILGSPARYILFYKYQQRWNPEIIYLQKYLGCEFRNNRFALCDLGEPSSR